MSFTLELFDSAVCLPFNKRNKGVNLKKKSKVKPRIIKIERETNFRLFLKKKETTQITKTYIRILTLFITHNHHDLSIQASLLRLMTFSTTKTEKKPHENHSHENHRSDPLLITLTPSLPFYYSQTNTNLLRCAITKHN